MNNTLQVEIGNTSFTTRKVDLAAIVSGIKSELTLTGLTHEVQITETSSVYFITINHQVCYYPGAIVDQVEQYAREAKLSDAGFWQMLTHAIIQSRRRLLMTDDTPSQFFPAIQNLNPAIRDEVRTECKAILIELLELNLALDDRIEIAEISGKYLVEDEIDWNSLREELITALNTRRLRIHINPDFFRKIFIGQKDDNLFNLMRDELFNESGLILPDIHLEFEPALAEGLFYFGYNAHTSIPAYISSPASPDDNRLRDVLILFKAFLKSHAYTGIDSIFLERRLTAMDSLYPDLTRIIRQRVEYPLTIRVLRLLAREGISVRNLPLIFESILSRDYIIADDQQYIIFDDRIAARPMTTDTWKQNANHVVEYVRIKLRRQISYQYTRGESTLSVYLLDPELEKWIDSIATDELYTDVETIEKIHTAFASELDTLAVDARVPVVLTVNKIRQNIHDIIASRFPKVHVLSYQELTTDTNVQPVARISLP